jgi:hypothetical protein
MSSVQIELRRKKNQNPNIYLIRNPNPNPKDVVVSPRRHARSVVFVLHDGLREAAAACRRCDTSEPPKGTVVLTALQHRHTTYHRIQHACALGKTSVTAPLGSSSDRRWSALVARICMRSTAMDRLDGGTHSLSEPTLGRRHTSPRSTEMTPRSLHRFSLSLCYGRWRDRMKWRVGLHSGCAPMWVLFAPMSARGRPITMDDWRAMDRDLGQGERGKSWPRPLLPLGLSTCRGPGRFSLLGWLHSTAWTERLQLLAGMMGQILLSEFRLSFVLFYCFLCKGKTGKLVIWHN